MAHRFIDISALPDITQVEMDFLDSSYFQSTDPFQTPQLPTPVSLIAQYGDGGSRVIVIDALNMVVKINSIDHMRLEEVQTMRAIRQVFSQDEIPIPEVFGWRKYGHQFFIYMSLVHGKTLRQAWPCLTEFDKTSIQNDLTRVILLLRQIIQRNPQNISSVNGGVVQDRYFKPEHEDGPFPNLKAFNDWMFAAATRQKPGNGETIQGLDHPHMYRDLLPDAGNVYFSHGDLTLRNIMVSGVPGSHRVSGIIDWEQAGWYPEYWEYCKMHFGAAEGDEWIVNDWPDQITEPHREACYAFMEYTLWRGG